ncbi:hypothetical protein A2cp1_0647 [Anaeromyxobacter dehalogenans 2CP-1]|uniref:Uncharacterized protein n=2 Tax=Anaeromyxobacter dehalogenans TaxID=161493 RepID=B8JCX6_ANAD2|nr:hypothetical protein A2cp1_0647 [Anaeromyxobacter dehalogenans 2CP-1]
MIPLAPIPLARHACPGCARPLRAVGFRVPGMRCLAALECPPCGRSFYGDLPSGHGLYYPMLLDRATGEVTGPAMGAWFGAWLRDGWRHRTSDPVPLEVERLRPVRRPLLLNCLDGIYGHALLKLLNAQGHLARHAAYDLVVLVPRFLRWMVPAGAAEVWTVDLPLRRGAGWYDWLADDVARRLPGPAMLSVGTGLPNARDVDIERFTGVAPFPERRLGEPVERAVVTFVLRNDRPWGADPLDAANRGIVGWSRRAAERVRLAPSGTARQLRRVARFGEALRALWPDLDLAVTGLGERGGLPDWIGDLRGPRPTPADERAACARFAASHLVLGVHGSNMLLPSAHAAATLEIAWGPNLDNAFQDLLLRRQDPRIAAFRSRVLPGETTPDTLAAHAASLLRCGPQANRFAPEWNDHDRLTRDPFALAEGAWRHPPADRPGPPDPGAGA